MTPKLMKNFKKFVTLSEAFQTNFVFPARNISLLISVIQILDKLRKHIRSSCSEVFCKKGVLSNFAKFTGKHPCQSLFSNFIKKRDSGTGVFL